MGNGPCEDSCKKPDMDYDANVVKYLRAQRHDFVNHIQVIWGYLQLNRPDQAGIYINELNNKLDIMGRVYKLDNPRLSLLLFNNMRKAYKSGISVDFDADVESMEEYNRYFDGVLLSILENSFEKVLDSAVQRSGSNKIYIDLYLENGALCISISDSIYSDQSIFCFDSDYILQDELQGISIYSKSDESGICYKIVIGKGEA